jgi:hypothetical protein
MENQTFETVLARYQQNLTEYKVTGNGALKPAIDTDKKWLDSYVASLDQRSQQQQTYIQRFVKEYENTNPELIAMQGKLKEIREKGPVLQDAYETEKKAVEEEPIDYTPYYVKTGLIVGVAVVVGVVSALRPAYMR